MNPFLTKGYHSPKYFCDRESETETITEAIKNNRDIILYGRRKIGKSSLVKHVLHKLDKNFFSVWIDLLPTQKFQGLVDNLATQILLQFEEKSSFGNKIWKGIKTLRPNINYDSLTGQPSVSFINQSTENAQNTFTDLLRLIGGINKKVILAFDEFQQIMNYPEQNVENYLRTLIQSIPNLSIIYSGSDQSLIEHMFTNINQPFYQSGQLMKLGPIDEIQYTEFIYDHFKASKKNISKEDILSYIQWCNHRTINIQILSNRIFSINNKKIVKNDIEKVKLEVLGELDDMYFTLRRIMTRIQWSIVIAIAKEGKVYEPYGKAFMKKYGFTNSSTIRRVIEKLSRTGVIFNSSDDEGDYFEIDDVFFQKWVTNTH